MSENEKPKKIEIVLTDSWYGEPFAKRKVQPIEKAIDDIVSKTKITKQIHFKPKLSFIEENGIEIHDKDAVEITSFTSEHGQTHTQYYTCFDMMEKILETLAKKLEKELWKRVTASTTIVLPFKYS